MFSTILTDDGAVSSDEELREGDDVATQDSQQRSNDRELKDQLLRKFGSHISSLKLEFSKKKKKGKLPREARQALLDWWNVHYKWPYPTVSTSAQFFTKKKKSTSAQSWFWTVYTNGDRMLCFYISVIV